MTSPGNFSGTASNLTPGFHILYAYATDGEDTLASPAPFGGESSPQVGTISSYGFLVTRRSRLQISIPERFQA